MFYVFSEIRSMLIPGAACVAVGYFAADYYHRSIAKKMSQANKDNQLVLPSQIGVYSSPNPPDGKPILVVPSHYDETNLVVPKEEHNK